MNIRHVLIPALLLMTAIVHAQIPNEQDCLGAIPVCAPIYYNEQSWIGSGNYPNEINPDQNCPYSCMDGEKNNAWYIITVQSSGMLRLSITPNNSSDDYDWAVYNLTEHECGEIYNNAIEMQASCNAAGGSGYHGTTGISSVNGGSLHCNGGGPTNKWNVDLPVSEGETYVLCVSNWSQTQDGYTLDYSNSTATIYDQSNPYIDIFQETIGCADVTELSIEFSELIKCETIGAEDFVLTNDEGFEFTVTNVIGEACELGGAQEKAFYIVFEPAIDTGGLYHLSIVGLISDLCDNNAQALTYDFELIEGLPPVDFDGLYPFWCVDDNPDTLYGNYYPEVGSGTFEGPGITDLGNNSALFDPGLAGPGGPYSITYEYTDEGGCSNDISRLVTVRGNPIQYTVGGGGQYCEGAEGPDVYLVETTSQAFVNYELYRDGSSTGQVVIGTGVGGINFGPQNVPGEYTVVASGNCGQSDMLGSVDIVMGIVPEVFNTSGGGFYCGNLDGVDIVLSDSENDIIYELLHNGTATGITLTGTGNAITFTNIMTAGWYRIFATNEVCYDTMAGSVQVGIHPFPESNAGDDLTIPYGTSTTLDGSASGGTPDFSYHWEPAVDLVNPDVKDPQTQNLYATTSFILEVTDINSCVDDDNMTVNITGGPLGVVVTAIPEVICLGEPSQLNAVASGGSGDYTYSWTSNPPGFTSNIANPVVNPNVTTQYLADIYDGFNSVNGSVSVEVNPLPGAVASADQVSIPYGSTTTVHGEATISIGPHSFSWDPPEMLINPGSASTATTNLEFDITFTVTITDDQTGCYDEAEIFIDVYGGPLQVVSVTASPNEICNTGEAVQLNAIVSGGTESYSYSWVSDPPGFTADIDNPVAFPTANTTYILTVDDGNDVIIDEISVIVHENPQADAGIDQTINYGTATQLDGSASGGSGSYTWSWTPGNQLIDPNVAKPYTQILEEPVVFELVATDFFGCQGSDEVVVNITGGPLGVSAHASIDEFCQNEITTLYALPHGGSEIYYYTWYDNSGIEISEDSATDVMPMDTTFYIIDVFDGFTNNSDTIWLFVNPLPEINLVPEGYPDLGDTIIACVFDTIILDAGNPGFNYEWSNHSPDRYFQVSTTGIGYDVQTHWVRVENPATGCLDTASLTIIFSFEECTGIDEISKQTFVHVYPNPSQGVFNYVIDGPEGEYQIDISTLNDKLLSRENIRIMPGKRYEGKIDLRSNSKGIYLLKVLNNDFLRIKKLVKF